MDKTLSAFQSLSLTDLLDARETFHIHLMNKDNVIGTAIGKYRQRQRLVMTRKRCLIHGSMKNPGPVSWSL